MACLMALLLMAALSLLYRKKMLLVCRLLTVLSLFATPCHSAPFWRTTRNTSPPETAARRKQRPVLLAAAALPSLSAGDANDNRPSLREWIQARCGPTGSSIWLYHGYLHDPLTGKRVAAVEGLELVRSLASSSSSRRNAKNKKEQALQQKNRHPHYDSSLLQVGTTLSNPNATYADAETILTRRLFCYKPVVASTGSAASDATTTASSTSAEQQQDSSRKHNPINLLREIRLRPTSPLRRIPLDQAVTVYDSATTFVQPSQNNDNCWHVHTEWPNGKALWTKARLGESSSTTSSSSSSPRTSRGRFFFNNNRDQRHVDFTVYARPQSKQQRQRQAPDLNSSHSDKAATAASTTTTTTSPARSALIQFGASNPDATPNEQNQAKFGARETYQWSYDSSCSTGEEDWFARVRQQLSRPFRPRNKPATAAATVRYTRYGEGPVWYGSAGGRMCMTELTGRRIDDTVLEELHHVASQTTAQVAAQHVPGFWSVLEPQASGKTVQQDPLPAIAAFRQQQQTTGGVAMPIVPDPEEILNSNKLIQWQHKAEQVMQRLRAATTWSVGGGSVEAE